MDYKEFYRRIDYDENKLNEVKKDLKELRVYVNSLTFPSNTCYSDINKMFDEKYRIEYALKLANGKRKVAANI